MIINKINIEKVKLTRQELYNLVWSEPLSRLARKFKISDNGLRKICKRMNIPIPVLGHWQKVQYGKPVKVIKLPTDYTGKDEVILEEKGPNDVDSNSPLVVIRRLSKNFLLYKIITCQKNGFCTILDDKRSLPP